MMIATRIVRSNPMMPPGPGAGPPAGLLYQRPFPYQPRTISATTNRTIKPSSPIELDEVRSFNDRVWNDHYRQVGFSRWGVSNDRRQRNRLGHD